MCKQTIKLFLRFLLLVLCCPLFVVCLFVCLFVYLFIVGGLGSRGARPRPNRAFHASLPSRQDSARRSRL